MAALLTQVGPAAIQLLLARHSTRYVRQVARDVPPPLRKKSTLPFIARIKLQSTRFSHTKCQFTTWTPFYVTRQVQVYTYVSFRCHALRNKFDVGHHRKRQIGMHVSFRNQVDVHVSFSVKSR